MIERPAKILVVDDVPENVRLLEAVLIPRGHEVVTASDGLEALDLVESEEPDLILLDVMMPGLDGYGGLHPKLLTRVRSLLQIQALSRHDQGAGGRARRA